MVTHWKTLLRQTDKYGFVISLITQMSRAYCKFVDECIHHSNKLRFINNMNFMIVKVGQNDEHVPRNEEYIRQHDKRTVFTWLMRLTNLYLSVWRHNIFQCTFPRGKFHNDVTGLAKIPECMTRLQHVMDMNNRLRMVVNTFLRSRSIWTRLRG
jgi:hypothetical protein